QSWTVAELEVFGRTSAGLVFQPPVLADPSSFAVAERRLRRRLDREPDSDAALLELRALYRRHDDRDGLADLDRLEHERFSPTVRVGWSFGGLLRLLGYDWERVGGRRIDLTYYWQAERAMDRDYAASVH